MIRAKLVHPQKSCAFSSFSRIRVKISCFNFFTEKKGSNHFPLFYLYTISEHKNKKWQPLFQSTTCAGLGYCSHIISGQTHADRGETSPAGCRGADRSSLVIISFFLFFNRDALRQKAASWFDALIFWFGLF